jgi:hypothetical protein
MQKRRTKRREFIACTAETLIGATWIAAANAEEPIVVSTQGNAGPVAFASFRTASYTRQLQPNRILVVRTPDEQDRLKEQTLLSSYLASMLRRRSPFSATVCRDPICRGCFPTASGRFDERKLLQWRERFNVDSILFCRIERIDAYEPMALELGFHLVHVPESVTVVSGSATFDLRDGDTRIAYEAFTREFCAPEYSRTIDVSPTPFIQFAAAELAGELSRLWP